MQEQSVGFKLLTFLGAEAGRGLLGATAPPCRLAAQPQVLCIGAATSDPLSQRKCNLLPINSTTGAEDGASIG
jgi:hypothetical protein